MAGGEATLFVNGSVICLAMDLEGDAPVAKFSNLFLADL